MRAVVAAALLLALAAGATWGIREWRVGSADIAQPRPTADVSSPAPSPAPPASEPSPEPAPSPAREPSPDPSEEPSPEPPPDDPADDGPATGPFAAFSPSHQLTHPDTDPDIRRWYDWFGYFVGDEVGVPSGEWTNKAELWDDLTGDIHDEVEVLGPEYERPLWGNDAGLPASVNVRWSNKDTSGRGELVEFNAVYLADDGKPRWRYWPVLIVTTEGRGEVLARMSPFEYQEDDFATYMEKRAEVGDREWQWITGTRER